MADHFLPATLLNLKHSFSLADIDFEFMNNFSAMNNPNNDQLMGFSQENLFPDCSPANLENLFIPNNNTFMIQSSTEKNEPDHNDRKRKSMDIVTPEINSANSSPQAFDNDITKKTGRSKRVKGKGKEKEKEKEKPMDVVHVRARRGQATDSHSLAERARRGKINERLRCLQEIVPGCYKTKGMAGMLDEIINYVQSLQNQIEFLSMKLTAASTFHELNSDTFFMETMQRAKALEALKIQNIANQGISVAQFVPLDLNFGYFPNLLNNR